MVGSLGIGAMVAQLAFWVLVVLGVANGALTKLGAAIFLSLWAVAYFALPRLAWWTGPIVTSYIAVLDIVLVFLVFRSDVKLT